MILEIKYALAHNEMFGSDWRKRVGEAEDQTLTHRSLQDLELNYDNFDKNKK